MAQIATRLAGTCMGEVRRLAARGANGEFIAVSGETEVHVFLYEGRLAWATSSASQSTLAAYLAQRHGVPRHEIARVVEECRRTRRRFGEVVVELGVATEAQVRDALLHQIVDTASVLADLVAPRSVFLPRALDYSRALTFSLDEVEAACDIRDTDNEGADNEGAGNENNDNQNGDNQNSDNPNSDDSNERTAIPMSSNLNIQNALERLRTVDGFVGACLVDSDSGMMLGAEGGGGVVNLEVAAAGNTDVVRAKRKVMKALALKDDIEDMLITLGRQYHLLRPLRSRPGVFFYMVLDRTRSNLAMSRLALADAEKSFDL